MIDGDLEEVDPAQMQRMRKREQATAETEEDLYQIGVARGYKKPRAWAKHIFQARQRKKLMGGRI
jgi:hypothetical protein